MGWDSFHIFYHDQSRWDQLLIYIYKQLKTIYNHKIPSLFFIRYWEGGPHIRLRIKDMEEFQKDKLVNSIYYFFDKFPSEREFKKNEFYKQYKMLTINQEDLLWFPNHSIQEIPYTQEIERYNGEKMMQLSELQFEFSSRYVFEFLESTVPDLQRKYNHGLYLLSYMTRSMNLSEQQEIDFLRSYCIATLQSYVPEDIERYLKTYQLKLQESNLSIAVKKYWSENSNLIINQYTSFTNEIIKSVRQDEFSFNEIRINSLEKLDVYSMAKIQLYWSWIHMFLNRIGLSPLTEAELTFLLSHSLNIRGVKK
ncbi:thiopeptide-type bacteriocin biosynthesis protein [uncultured Metabacillus sp.]|uniref:thiopeptide-type bacteriocin biosynthesis protein n=1 Tax=uncultured Metabacillus sp. TaxID=2860135 RepID=UPI00262B2C30|nr:thiopeptide-type bacteriocin biosynthesis protein [uncultured Metabacillus sp.]